jgi:hypothetical protein
VSVGAWLGWPMALLLAAWTGWRLRFRPSPDVSLWRRLLPGGGPPPAIVRSGPAASAEDLEQATIRLLEVLRLAA